MLEIRQHLWVSSTSWVFCMTNQNKATQSVCLTFNFSIYFPIMSLSEAVTLAFTIFEMADLLLWVQEGPAHRSCPMSFPLSPPLASPWWWDGVVKETCFCIDVNDTQAATGWDKLCMGNLNISQDVREPGTYLNRSSVGALVWADW